MGMYDTYIPGPKLQHVLVKELGVHDSDFQTKSLDCEMIDMFIDDELKLKVDPEIQSTGRWSSYYSELLTQSITGADDPYVSEGEIYFDFEQSVLTRILYGRKGIYLADDALYKPMKLITFESIDNYTVVDVVYTNKEAWDVAVDVVTRSEKL